MSTLVTVWDSIEQAYPDKVAVVDGKRRVTYSQFGDQIRRLATGLDQHWEVRPGDVVALLAPNCLEFIVTYFAITRLNGLVQPLDERLDPETIKAILADSEASYLIIHPSLRSKYEKIKNEVPLVDHILSLGDSLSGSETFGEWLGRFPSLKNKNPISSENAAELMYTSGTTGEPKGVMRSHTNVLAASRNSIRGFGYRDNDTIVIVMPLSHSSALNSQLIPLIQLGGTVVLLDHFSIGGVIETIQKERVTCMRVVPSMLRMLLSSSAFSSDTLPSLRLIVNSSAAIDVETFKETKRRFPLIEVMNSYGLTEASTSTILSDEMGKGHADSIGVPIDGVEMCVMDGDGQVVEEGQIGEICIRGEHVFIGYRNHSEETKEVFQRSWLRTGDLGCRDADGFYYIHGRINEMINCGGRKFSPIEVENCILQLKSVSEVAVVGVTHRVLGEVAKAYVVSRNGVELDSKVVTRHCSRQLPGYKIPFFVDIVKVLPKNAVGKVLRRKLKEAIPNG